MAAIREFLKRLGKKKGPSKQDYENRRAQLTEPLKRAMRVPNYGTTLAQEFNRAEAQAKLNEFGAAIAALDEVERIIKLAEQIPDEPLKGAAIMSKLEAAWLPAREMAPLLPALQKFRDNVVTAVNNAEYDLAESELTKVGPAVDLALKAYRQKLAAAKLKYEQDKKALEDGDLKKVPDSAPTGLEGPFGEVSSARGVLTKTPKTLEEFETDTRQLATLAEKVTAYLDAVTKQQQAARAWEGLANAVKATEGQLTDLKKWGVGAAEAHQRTLDGIKAKAGDTQKKYQEAIDGFGGLQTQVNELHAAEKLRTDWQSLKKSGAYVLVKARVADLEKWNAPEKGTMKTKLEDLDKKAKAKEYDKAISGFDTFKGELATVHGPRRQLREHELAMQDIKGLLTAAAGVAEPGTDGPLKVAVLAFKAARPGVPDVEADTAKAGGLAAKREDLRKKAQAVVDEFKKTGDPTSGAYKDLMEKKYKAEYQKAFNKYYLTSTTPDKTPEIARLKTEVRDAFFLAGGKAGETPPDYVAAEKALATVFEKAQRILDLRKAGDKDQAQFYKKYRAIEKRLTYALNMAPSGQPETEAKAALVDYHKDTLKPAMDRNEYKKCKDQLLPELVKKLDDALKVRVAKANSDAAGVNGKPTPAAKSNGARDLINGLDPEILESMDSVKKLGLLESLHAGNGVPGFDGSNRDDPKRVAQRKLYLSISMDDQFIKEDNEKRKELVKNLANNEILKKAKEDWAILTDEQRAEALKEAAREQCAAFGYKLPPGGITLKDFGADTEGDNGQFNPKLDPTQNDIELNTRSVAMMDFESALDLIIHENSHNYQNQLIARLAPNYTPAKDRITETGPNKNLYKQAMMFKVSDPYEAYVKGGEEEAVYRKQPQEEHAWYAGPKTAHGLMKALTSS